MTAGGPAQLWVSAVITWFRPAAEAIEGLRDAARECGYVVVVDNTPLGEPSLSDSVAPRDAILVLRPGSNRGLAAALNLGVERVPASSGAVLLLDQDSRLPPGLVGALSAHLQDPGVGGVAPAPWDADEQRYLDPRTGSRAQVATVPVVITSGLLVHRGALQVVGPFREDFFVDAVDLDFCMRLRRAGYRLLQDRSLLMSHRLGSTRWHSILGVRVRASHHPGWRLYSGARNGTVLIREHLTSAPGWAVTNALLLAYWLATVIAFEPPRRSRARLFVQGVADGWRGASPRIPVPPRDHA